MRGKFITIEGIEGVGKSTNIESIAKFLMENDIEYLVTREPGGTTLAEDIRDLLLKVDGEEPVELCELLLVFASRAQHLKKIIEPALNNGVWVLCDRFTDATYAYQGYGRGFELGQIEALETLVQRGRHPDLTILFDIDPRLGMTRARQRAELDRFEEEHVEFFDRVREGYLTLAKNEARFRVIDASQSIDLVQQALRELLLPMLSEVS